MSSEAEVLEMLEREMWEENKAEMAQLVFQKEVTLTDSPSFAELVEERCDKHGQDLVAEEAITAFTFAGVPKVRL